MRRSESDRSDDAFKIRSAGGRFLMGGEQQPRIELAVWSAVAGMTRADPTDYLESHSAAGSTRPAVPAVYY